MLLDAEKMAAALRPPEHAPHGGGSCRVSASGQRAPSRDITEKGQNGTTGLSDGKTACCASTSKLGCLLLPIGGRRDGMNAALASRRRAASPEKARAPATPKDPFGDTCAGRWSDRKICGQRGPTTKAS